MTASPHVAVIGAGSLGMCTAINLVDQGARVKVLDAQSIASEVPTLFEGRLPALNLGTADGKSCSPALQAALEAALQRQRTYTMVLNGRFTGGYITRHFGRPADRVHAVQLEMAESTYMDENAPYGFRTDLAKHIRPVLRGQLETVLAWARLSS